MPAYLTGPRASPRATLPNVTDGPARPTEARRFLVADDDPDMQFLVPRLIRRLRPNAIVHVAGSASEALMAIDDADAGDGLVVISDYDMGPGPTGTELLAEIARRHPRARRILLTGRPIDAIAHAGVEPHRILPKDSGLQALRKFLEPAAEIAAPGELTGSAAARSPSQ